MIYREMTLSSFTLDKNQQMDENGLYIIRGVNVFDCVTISLTNRTFNSSQTQFWKKYFMDILYSTAKK